MTDKTYTVLFLCTSNAARSIMAESILNHVGQTRFRGYSAGSQPGGKVHPFTIELLEQQNFPISDLRSKSWNEFAKADAPRLDFVFTVCDQAANEICPVWPGQPMTAHWGVPDPVEAKGNEAMVRLAFAESFRMLSMRISILVNLPILSLDRLSLQKQLDEIGRTLRPTA